MSGADAQAVRDKLGLSRPQDLILHLPLRYEDETRLTPLRDLQAGSSALVEGVIVDAEVRPKPRRQLVATLADPANENHALQFRLLHFYPNQVAQLKPGVRVRLFGEVRGGLFGTEMVHPRYRVVQAGDALPDRLTPVYPSVAGLSQTAIRRAVALALAETDLADTLPPELLRARHLPDFEASVRLLHAPPPEISPSALETRTHPAWRRIGFDELLAQQLSLALAAQARRARGGIALAGPHALAEQLIAQLPFALTAAQRRAWDDIRADLAATHPMHRLLQGDVGSGKTCVAALAALAAVGRGQQAAVMAPTEILAEQLYRKFDEWLAPLGVRVAWLTSALKGKSKRETLAALASGEVQVAVGTHALFQAGVEIPKLALAIVDEQHRFGVGQRLALREKGPGVEVATLKPPGADAPPPLSGGDPSPLTPHLLMMSATPIPRTLAMSYFADLDVSVIDELPPGRTPVVTKLFTDARRLELIARVRSLCEQGGQAYWVCPLIEESEKLDLKAALDAHAELSAALPELRVGLAHGRMKSEEKNAAMAAFKAGEIDLLVATTVIEVGVDVPNASLMVIEHAERMGLSQLHQLRGRVGRGAQASTCVLLYQGPLSEAARERLRVMHETTDGFEIARRDLLLRGPGELLGARQSGALLLRFADPERDLDLIEAARDTAAELIARHPQAVDNHLRRWFGGRPDFLAA
jgi:ATP-dependent DNA helicase RecG